jgi:WhiB family redox-sensing transcriptional regulator
MIADALADLEDLAATEPWMREGRCGETDPEIFFPEKGGSVREAKKICARCPVRAECLDYALGHDEQYGVWGGTSEQERRRMRRDQDLTRAA